MKFLHTADWHIGKKLHGYDLLEEQKAAFVQILKIAKTEQVDAIVIAGDLYDRSVPSVEAIKIFNDMMIQINLKEEFPVLAISGNHDSSIRLETGGPWFSHTQFHLHTRLDQAFQPVELGEAQFFLLPYFEPIAARLYFEDDEIRTVEQAMTAIVAEMQQLFAPDKKHILVSHFFAAGSQKSDSETKLTVGGLDTVPVDLLASFDYVALGHLHGKDALKAPNARYSGSPVKFSLSERTQEKGVWLVEAAQDLTYTFCPLTPLRDIQQLTGDFKTFTSAEFYQNINREDYLYLQLTDRAIIPNMMNQLRQIYPRILGLERLYGRETLSTQQQSTRTTAAHSPQEMISEFFTNVTGEALSDQQLQWTQSSLATLLQEERGK
jgi:exonuclease SbcD